MPQFAVLTMIAAYPPLSDADIARPALLTPQTVNVIVRNLEKRGTITKSADEIHGRILRLEITELGIRLLVECKQRAELIEATLTRGLTLEEETVIRVWLSRISRGESPKYGTGLASCCIPPPNPL